MLRFKGSSDTQRLLTTLSSAQEAIVVELRRMLLLALDDLLLVVREFIEPLLSRSALDRLLRRRDLSHLSAWCPSPKVWTGDGAEEFQGLRARLCAYGYQIPPADAR